MIARGIGGGGGATVRIRLVVVFGDFFISF